MASKKGMKRELIPISEYVLSGSKDLVVFDDKGAFDKHFGEQEVWYFVTPDGRAFVTGEQAVFVCEGYDDKHVKNIGTG